jgi:ribosomal protein S1
MAKGGGFHDGFDDLLREASGMSDADLERLLLGGASPAASASRVESLEPGTRVHGVVVDLRGGEVLVELDGKTLGVISDSEFTEDLMPSLGERVEARFERFDRSKDLAILSVGSVRKEVLWEELRRGSLIEGTVSAVNKGGLTLDVKGIRAFLPVSQIELSRVEDLTPYLGQKLRCVVTEVDRASHNLVVSRRAILEEEAEAGRVDALTRISEGEVLKGKVVRITDHGAFVNLGGVDGLIPRNKVEMHLKARSIAQPLAEGQEVQVRVVRVDRERERVSLDLMEMEAAAWKRTVEGYVVGEAVTGWVTRRTAEEACLSIDEGVEGVIPSSHIHLLEKEARPGSIVKAVIAAIDRETQRIILHPAPGPAKTKNG